MTAFCSRIVVEPRDIVLQALYPGHGRCVEITFDHPDADPMRFSFDLPGMIHLIGMLQDARDALIAGERRKPEPT